MKKLFIILLILSVCAIIAIGCGPTATPAPTTPAASKTTPAATVPAATTPGVTTPASSKPTTTTTTATKAPATPIYGGVLRYIQTTGPNCPIGTPWLATGGATFHMQFCEQFLLKEQIDGSLKPGLAQSYEISNDPKNPSITLHLVKGAKFHDGSDFNAGAVKWNLEQAMSPNSLQKGSTTTWKSIDVIDDYTIKINLKYWDNTIGRTFAEAASYQVSPVAYKKNGEEWMHYHMVGTGPFVHTDFKRDVSLTMVRNPEYWEKGKPYLDKVEIIIVSDELTQQALFKTGGADVWGVSARIAQTLQNEGYRIVTGPPMGSTLVPGSANPDSPWANKKVREAIEYAIDKEALAKAFGYGFSTPSYQYFFPGSPAYDPNLTPRKYDLAKAKQLLTEAGYPNGFETTINCSAQGTSRDVPVALQAQLAEAGIKVELNFPQSAAWTGMLTGTWKGALLASAMGYANPNGGWKLVYGPASTWYKSMKRPDGWAEAYATSLATPEMDKALMLKCEGLLYNDVNTIPLLWGQSLSVVNKNLQDHGLGTRGLWSWFEPQNAWYNK